MKKVMSIAMTGMPVDHSDNELSIPSSAEPNGHGISCFPLPSNLSSVVWERMVSKAKTIVSDPASMSPVPGSSNKSRFVVSFCNPSSPM